MNKPEKKFLITSVIAVFVSLTLLLGIINAINFTMASEDADKVTELIAQHNGSFQNNTQQNPMNQQFPDGQQMPDGQQFPDGQQMPSFGGGRGPMGGQGTFPGQGGQNGQSTWGGQGSQNDQGTFNQDGQNSQGTFPGQGGQSGQNTWNGQGGQNDQGTFSQDGQNSQGTWNSQVSSPFQMGPMGPSSPETNASTRYFTIALNKEDNSATLVAYSISAFSQDEALSLAQELAEKVGGAASNGTTNNSANGTDGGSNGAGAAGNPAGGQMTSVGGATGWTRGTYRYRVYEQNGLTYVTVIDQGRELVSCYRILVVSGIGITLGTLLSFVILRLIAKRLFAPVEAADRKQKEFIRQAEKEFKVPLTVISADNELIERKCGPSDETRSIHRQVGRMQGLVRDLGRLAVVDTTEAAAEVDLSVLMEDALQKSSDLFKDSGIQLSHKIAPHVTVKGNPKLLGKTVEELVNNTVKFAKSEAAFTLGKEGDRTELIIENDTALADQEADQVFDRFTKLENASEEDAGLGLSFVREIVREMDGRCRARVEGGHFKLEIKL